HVDGSRLQRQLRRLGVNQPAPQTPQLEVALHNDQVVGRRAARDHLGAVPGVLYPIRTQSVTEAEQSFTPVLAELEQARQPFAVAEVAGVLRGKVPLETERLRRLPRRAAIHQRLARVQSVR